MNHPSPRTYAFVFVALLLLLCLTVGAAFVDLDRFFGGHGLSLTLAILIGALKAILIVTFFMHVGYRKRVVWAFAGAGFLWLAILLSLTMSDYVTRNNPPAMNFKGEPRFLATR